MNTPEGSRSPSPVASEGSDEDEVPAARPQVVLPSIEEIREIMTVFEETAHTHIEFTDSTSDITWLGTGPATIGEGCRGSVFPPTP